jgi:uridylate kinase
MGAVWENPAAAAVPGKYRWCLNMAVQYKRILLKVSGEALSGEKGTGFDETTIASICAGIKAAYDLGAQIGIVVGGGNFWRGVKDGEGKIERTRADHMGMLATVINALGVADGLEQLGLDVRVQTAIAMQEVAEPYIRNRAVRHLEKGRVVVFGCGTGNPFFSTDTGAALRAAEIEADVILKATMVDGVYDSDPKQNPEAKKYDTLSYMDVLSKNLGVMDMTAASFCRDRHIPFLVFSIEDPQNIVRAVTGEKVGTLVQ